MENAKFALLIVASLGFAAASAEADVVESTLSQWNGATEEAPWGVPNTSAYGETLTAPAGTDLLNSVTFEIKDTSAPIAYQSYVYAWNGTNAMGPALYASSVNMVGVSSGFQAVTMTADASVVAGQQYVAFLFAESGGLSEWGVFSGASSVSGSNEVFSNVGSSFGELTSKQWDCIPSLGCSGDYFAFSADFANVSAVPMPAAAWLMLGGLGGLGVMRRKRQFH